MDPQAPTPTPVPPPPAPPVKNSLLVIMSLLLLIAVGLAGFFYWQMQRLAKQLAQYQTQPSPLTSPQPSAEAGDPTANWKTYRNEQYGFEMKYPLDFKEQKAESDTTLLKITKTDRGSLYDFGIRVIKNYKINQIVSKVEEVKEINIGDRLGYEYFYIEGAGMSEVALIQIGQDALSINFDCIGSGQNFATPNDRKIYVQDFLDQILSTFKFAEENRTKTDCKEPRPEVCTMECVETPLYICGSDGKSYCSVCQACSNKNVDWYEMRASPCGEGQFCGGIAGTLCPESYYCKYDGNYPDASGVCTKK